MPFDPYLAFLFPGQGSQSVGMLKELGLRFPLIQETYLEASERLGYNLWQVTQEGPESLLNQTEYTQPALLAGSVALFRLWRAQGGELPAWVAGHSLGEYTALVCGGALDYLDAISLVALRGRLMQESVQAGEGAMVAIIGLTDEEVMAVCAKAAGHDVLSPANFNAIGQTVLAGHAVAATRAIDIAKAMGAKIAKLIPVSVPSHCLLMKPAAEKLAVHLRATHFNKLEIPMINNVDVAFYEEPDQIRAALAQQLYSPVHWVETIQLLVAKGMRSFVECGPGKVLAGLNKRIVPEVGMVSIGTEEGLMQGLRGI